MVTTELLDRIERRYGVALPATYRRMQIDGVCDYGESREEWLATWRARMFDRPPALLCALDFEWWPLARVLAWTPPDFWEPDLGLLPFAQDGAGGVYAFRYPWAESGCVPVVGPLHEFMTQGLARDIDGWLYRAMLEALTFASSPDDEDEDAPTWSERQRSWRANVATLAPYLRDEWHADLASLIEREPCDWTDRRARIPTRYRSAMNVDELARRQPAWTFPYLGERFRHVRP